MSKRKADSKIPAASPAEEILIKVDLHNHTNFSFDGEMSPRDFVRYYGEKNFGAVAVTDHNTRLGALAVRELDPPFQVIVGCEIKTSRGELIGLFLDKDVRPGMDPVNAAKAIHDMGGLTLLPHPFLANVPTRMDAAALPDLLPHLDIVEGINARGDIADHDRTAVLWARRNRLALSGGSDAHNISAAGTGYVLMSPFDGPRDFLEKLRQGFAGLRRRETFIRAPFNLMLGYSFGWRRVNRMIRMHKSGAPLRTLWEKPGPQQRGIYW